MHNTCWYLLKREGKRNKQPIVIKIFTLFKEPFRALMLVVEIFSISSEMSFVFICFRQILLTSEIMVCIGVLLSFHIIFPYSEPQYICSGLLLFVSAEVLEGNLLFSFTFYVYAPDFIVKMQRKHEFCPNKWYQEMLVIKHLLTSAHQEYYYSQ